MEKSIVTKAGCQPYWNRFDMGGTPFCKNASTLQQYSDEVTKFSYLYKNELVGETKCLIPCSFTEYKVNIIFFA